MNNEFLSTVAVIAPDPLASRKLYVDALGLPLANQGGEYHHRDHIAGCESFGIWPLAQAAEACFGTPQWPAERPVPQVSIELDVADVAAVGGGTRARAGWLRAAAPTARGALGQMVARLQSPEGALVGTSYAVCCTRRLTGEATASRPSRWLTLPFGSESGLCGFSFAMMPLLSDLA